MNIRNNNYLKQPAIYIITNKINHKVYVGETMNMKQRSYGYTNNVHNRPIKHAIRKHGIDNFDIQIEYFPNFTKDELILLEGELIERFKSTDRKYGYNVTSKGLDNTGKKLTAEHKKKIGDGNRFKIVSEETKERMRAYQSNMTESHKRNISEGKLKKKFKHSDETKKKMSDSKKGKPSWNKGKRTGKPSHRAKITHYQRLEILEMLKCGITGREIAKKYNVTPTTISRIKIDYH